jgi:hypothetical protein
MPFDLKNPPVWKYGTNLEGINHFGINVLLESHITISQSQFHEPGFTFLTRLEREGERER